MIFGRSGGDLGYTHIDAMDPQVDANGEFYIPIHYYFPTGNGNSISADSALVKPFRKLMEEGKHIGKTTFVFYNESNTFFVLGSFVHTRISGRTIFFPGLILSRVIHTPAGRDLTNAELHNIEHFTLEKNLTDWHVTLSQKRSQGITYPTLKTNKVTDDAVLWFVMAISDVNKLELMPKTQQYQLKGPKIQELERRREIMVESRKGSIFQVTELNNNPTPPYFINFEFFISHKRKKELDLPENLLLILPPLSKLEEMKGIQSRAHDLSLDNSISVSIRVSKIRGTIQYDALYVSGDRL
jgi:hypothetical protein